MTSLALSFQETQFDVIDRNNQPWLRSNQIGLALEYKNPELSINKLYRANSDEFSDAMTALVELETKGGKQKVRIFSLRGAHLLAMFARTKIAKEFRKWVLDILDRETAVPPSPISEETLTPSETQTLHEVIDRKAAGCGVWKVKAYPEIYTRLQNRFRVNSYKLLPRSQLADAILYVTEMELRNAPKQLPERIPVRKVSDLSFFSKSGRKGSHRHGPESFSNWWDYPQHLKELKWEEGLKVGRGFFAEVAELAEHDEHAAYIVIQAVLGIAWPLPAGNPERNGCIEHGFSQAMAVAVMTGLRAMRGGATAYAWGM